MATDNKGPMIITVCWVFTSLSLIFVIARIFCRWSVHRRLYSDDFWIILGTACSITANILTTISVNWGNGQHFATLDLEQKTNTIKFMMASYVVGIEALGLPKLGVVSLLTRLLSPSQKHRIVLWTMAIICCLSLTAMVTTLMLQCSPPKSLWDFTQPTRNCLPPSRLIGLAFWASTCSAFLDFYLAIYPGIVLMKLKMPVTKKVALACALGFGIVSGCIGIVKATGVPTLASTDVSYDLCDPLYWTNIEGSMIIIAACIPVLQPLVELIKGRRIWTKKSSGGSSGNGHSGGGRYGKGGSSSGGRLGGGRSKSKSEAFEMNATFGGTQITRKKVDIYGFTVNDREGSEESIVKQAAASAGDPTTGSDGASHNSAGGIGGGGGERGEREQGERGGIVQSTSYSVSYDDPAGPVSSSKRWMAV